MVWPETSISWGFIQQCIINFNFSFYHKVQKIISNRVQNKLLLLLLLLLLLFIIAMRTSIQAFQITCYKSLDTRVFQSKGNRIVGI